MTKTFRIVADKRDGTAPRRLMAQEFGSAAVLRLAEPKIPQWDREGWHRFRLEGRTPMAGWVTVKTEHDGSWFGDFINDARARS